MRGSRVLRVLAVRSRLFSCGRERGSVSVR